VVLTRTMSIALGEHVPTADQRVVMYGVPWTHFETQLALRGDTAGPRMAYLEGTLELMTPSRDHERITSYIGRLIETFALERNVVLSPYRSWTLKHAPRAAGVEPDECYIFGDQRKSAPDLVIEVVWTSGGIDKLEIYRRLSIPEVWFWIEGRIDVHVLGTDGYAVGGSRLLPDLYLDLVAALLERPTVLDAMRALRDSLRGG
jgi:Uma2 family endonuclease